MQFLVIGLDGSDAGALERRMASRDAHLALSSEAQKAGDKILGAALLREDGTMKGSVAIFDFPTQADLEKWLDNEPYINGKVWEKVEIIPCKLAPSFEPLLKKSKQ